MSLPLNTYLGLYRFAHSSKPYQPTGRWSLGEFKPDEILIQKHEFIPDKFLHPKHITDPKQFDTPSSN